MLAHVHGEPPTTTIPHAITWHTPCLEPQCTERVPHRGDASIHEVVVCTQDDRNAPSAGRSPFLIKFSEQWKLGSQGASVVGITDTGIGCMHVFEMAPDMARGFLLQGDTAARHHDFVNAAMFYDAALAIFESTNGRTAPALLGPLLRLAHALENLGEQRSTEALLQRARTIVGAGFAPMTQAN